jgi:rod shape-determining protein MreD
MDNSRPGIRPRPSAWRRMDSMGRRSFPLVTTVLLLLAGAAPLELPGQAQLQVAAALCCVYFWSVFRPASMPPLVVFVIGLLGDLLDFAPVGVGVLSLLILHGLALRWRRGLERQGFVLTWLVFIGLSTGAAILQWLLLSLLAFRLMPPGPLAFQTLLSVGLYPLLAVPLAAAHRTLAEPEAA